MRLLALLTLSIFFVPVFGQFENNGFIEPGITDYGEPNEVFLDYPDDASCAHQEITGTDFHDGEYNNTIFYGKVPPNHQGKPVVVFLHGYSSNSECFTEGCDNMYSDVYNDGYRSAYLSASPNHHMWTNGNMVSNMLDKILDHYRVDDVVMVGWSKGGLDIDAAIALYGAGDKISHVISLSSPFHGTAFGELAQSWLLAIPNIILDLNNDAARCLQRGYMNYVRQFTDSRPSVAWTTMGAYGWGPYARVLGLQLILNLYGGHPGNGGNDGVVPYYSSKRPRSAELFGGQYYYGYFPFGFYTGPQETNLDHFEIIQGKHTWRHIKNTILTSPYVNSRSTTVANAFENPNSTIKGTGKLYISNGTPINMKLEKANRIDITVIANHADMHGEISLIDEHNNTFNLSNEGESDILSAIQYSTSFEDHEEQVYTLNAPKNALIIVNVEGGIEPVLHTGLAANKLVYTTNETPNIYVDIPGNYNAEINATITKTTNLDASKVFEFEPIVVSVEKNGNIYQFETPKLLEEGIYEILVHVNGDFFEKTLSTTIAVTQGKLNNSSSTNTDKLSVYPNPILNQNIIYVAVNVVDPAKDQLVLYDLLGKVIQNITLSNYNSGQQEISITLDPKLDNNSFILNYRSKEKTLSTLVVRQ